MPSDSRRTGGPVDNAKRRANVPEQRALYDTPASPAQLGKRIGAQRSLAPIRQALSWLSQQFLADQTVPRELKADCVVPVLDVLQGGWALGQTQTISIAAPVGNSAQIVPPATDVQQAVTFLSCTNSNNFGSQGSCACRLYLQTGPTTASKLYVASFTMDDPSLVGGGLVADWKTITGRSDAVLIVPPGYGLFIELAVTSIGLSLPVIAGLVTSMPLFMNVRS